MERLGKEWLRRRIYQGTLRLNGKDTLVPPEWVVCRDNGLWSTVIRLD